MSIQKKPPVPSLLVNTEPLIVVKNEPPEPENIKIGIDDILDSSNEEIPLDIKDVDIVEHILCEDSIKTETVDIQLIVKTENASFIKTENLIERENLNKTEDATESVSRGTGPGVEEIQGSNEYFSDKKFKLKYQLGRHILTHEQRLELCPVCGKGFATKSRARIHLRFVHNKEPRKRLKCHECEYTSLKKERLKYHIKTYHGKTKNTLIRLKLEGIQYFCCYHCSYKSSRKDTLKSHIFRHFKKEEIKFQCYVCDFMTLKRDLITEHIKKHSQVQEGS